MMVREMNDTNTPSTGSGAKTALAPAQDQVLALHVEEVAVAKRMVPRGLVRVSKVTESRDHLVQETLRHQRVEVERVEIGIYVDHVPPTRHEDGVTIIPVLEEVIVTERRLLLKEEIRLRTVITTEGHVETIALRSQKAVIERILAADPERPTSDPVNGAT